MGKSSEFITYAAPGCQQICFPVAKVTGSRPGPKVLITAGIHGCEYPGIVAAIRLFQELEPADLCGEVTIVTISGLLAFEKRSVFVCPVDGKNPNRCLPGNPQGSYTDVLTYHLLHDFIAQADYYLDLHGGDMVEALEPFSIYHAGENDETERLSREIVEYYGLPNIVATVPGGTWDDRGTTYANGAKAGVPSAILEVGGIGLLDQPSVDMHLAGLRNVLRHFKCLKGEAVKPQNLQLYRDFHWLRSPAKGIFYKEVEIGDKIRQGQKIGQVEDYFGHKLAEITAPCEGKLLFLTTSPAMEEQGLVLGLGVL